MHFWVPVEKTICVWAEQQKETGGVHGQMEGERREQKGRSGHVASAASGERRRRDAGAEHEQDAVFWGAAPRWEGP